MLILASVAISLTLGKNGIFNRAKDAKEKYKIAEIREKVELAILEIQTREVELGNEVTIEKVLQELLDNKTFEKIDKAKQTGDIEDYEVKLKYDEKGNVVIEYIKKVAEVSVTYTLDPSTYTNKDKVTIKLVAQGKVKSITTPKGQVITTNKEKEEIDYEVETNGTYKFIIENKLGEKEEKNIIVDIIDRETPQALTITAKSETGEITITGSTEDAEANETSVKSGMSHYKYYAKLTTETEYKEYDTNEIRKQPTGENLPAGTYNVYAKAFDKAGNWVTSNTTTVTVAEWIQIWNEADLRNIANGLNKNYIIMQDITLTGTWTAIGNDATTAFKGKLNGDNHKIIGLKIEQTAQNDAQGLFGYIGTGAKVSNLNLEFNIDAKKSYVGGLVGYNQGTIEEVTVSGTIVTGANSHTGGIAGRNISGTIRNSHANVTASKIDSGYLGGIAGLNDSNGRIENSSSSGTLSGGVRIGGLVGYMTSGQITNSSSSTNVQTGNSYLGGFIGEQTGGTVTYCFATGNVNIEGMYGGGFVGSTSGGTIKDSYSTGNVTGGSRNGGFVGSSSGTITNAYSIGHVAGSGTGGFVYNYGGGSITNAYWNPNKAGVTTSAKGTKIENEADMNKQATYTGFDFTSVWIMKEYPELR